MKKQKPMVCPTHSPSTSLSQKIDNQLGYLSNYILELEDSTLQVDLESLEPEEVDGELFFKACAVQSSTEESIDDLDKLEGTKMGQRLGGEVRGPGNRHINKKIIKNYDPRGHEVRFDS